MDDGLADILYKTECLIPVLRKRLSKLNYF